MFLSPRKQTRAARRHRAAFRPGIDALPIRELMTTGVSAVLDGTLLRVTGTDAAETIWVQKTYNSGSVVGVAVKQTNGTLVQVPILADGWSQQVVPAGRVARVLVDARGGDDEVLLSAHKTSPTFDVQYEVDLPSTLLGGAGNDLLVGGRGNDELHGHDGNDTLIGGGGNDWLQGWSGANTLDGGSGNDTLLAGGNDAMSGGDGDDRMVFHPGTAASRIDGGAGNDTLDFSPREGAVFVSLQDGYGTMLATQRREFRGIVAAENVIGSRFSDHIVGNTQANLLEGQGGDDILYGGGLNDTLLGGAGNDSLHGGAGDDSIDGGGGHDTVTDWQGKVDPRNTEQVAPDTLASSWEVATPIAFLTGGYGDPAAWRRLVEQLKGAGFEVRELSWDNFNGKQENSLNSDGEYLRIGRVVLDSLPAGKKVVLTGYSFGGDSALKLASMVRRRIDFLGVVDPVAMGGLRVPGAYAVRSNVGYFFNRWQENSPWPINFGTSGRISNVAPQVRNDQVDANIQRRADGTPFRVRSNWFERNILGYPDEVQVRNGHLSIMREDEFVRGTMLNIIRSL